MAYNYEYPYADMSRGNIDWLLNEMKALKRQVEEIYSTAAAEIIARNLDRLLPDATYDSTHERLIIHVEPVIVAGGEHVYSPSEETITIEGGV